MRTRQMAYLRPEEIIAERNRVPVVYLPIGPLEWHGPHLPLGMDALHAEQVALRTAEATGGLVLPTLYWGTERERSPELLDWFGLDRNEWVVGMDFPSNWLPSLYASEEVFSLLVREQLRLTVNLGFRIIVTISGHGADNQLAVLQRLAVEFSARTSARVLSLLPFLADESGVVAVGHASRIETALMQALHPETVRLEALPPLPEPLRNADWAIIDYHTFAGQPTPDRTVWEDDDPRRADPQTGRTNLERASAVIAAQVNAALHELNSA